MKVLVSQVVRRNCTLTYVRVYHEKRRPTKSKGLLSPSRKKKVRLGVGDDRAIEYHILRTLGDPRRVLEVVLKEDMSKHYLELHLR